MTSPMDLPELLALLSRNTSRPRYSFMVLNLIAQACGSEGRAGPSMRVGDRLVPLRDWLCDALSPMASRDPRRLKLAAQIEIEFERTGRLPADPLEARALVEATVVARVRQSGKTNISRSVSELVRASLMTRHYQGYRVDHVNRGAQRQAVYTVPEHVRAALSGGAHRPAA